MSPSASQEKMYETSQQLQILSTKACLSPADRHLIHEAAKLLVTGANYIGDLREDLEILADNN